MNFQPKPRAICGTVRGEADANQILRNLQSAFTDFQERHNGRLDNIEAAVDRVLSRSEADFLGGSSGSFAPEPDYTSAFKAYARKGEGVELLRSANAVGDRATVHAAMSVGSNTDGGYLAPVEWDRKLLQKQRALSPMRRIAQVQTTSTGAYTSLWSDGNAGSGWVGETAARPATTTPGLSSVPFSTGEIYANAAATQRLLDDGAINVDDFLVDVLSREFDRQEGIAFLSGDGVNKPNGLLTYAPGGVNAATHPGGSLGVTEAAITYDGLVDFHFGLEAPYRQSAVCLMSSLTAAQIAKLKDANGLPIWREGLMAGQPATLLGRPVEIDEGMPAPAATNLAIAFGDFQAGYLINQRIGTRILRDPFTNKPFVQFYATKRVGAGVLDPNAIRLLKVPV